MPHNSNVLISFAVSHNGSRRRRNVRELKIPRLMLASEPKRSNNKIRTRRDTLDSPKKPNGEFYDDNDAIDNGGNNACAEVNLPILESAVDFGTITSPNYPANYPDDANCSWIIHATDGFAIELLFVDFNIQYDSTCR